MGNLKKRELIILGGAALLVLWAAYELLINKPASKKAKESTETVKVDTFVSGITNDLSKNKVDDLNLYVIKKLESDWQKNPFWEKGAYKAWASREGGPGSQDISTKVVYSGYVDSGKNKMAVLNGVEYRIDEALEIDGYILRQITPSNVVILDKYTGSKIEVPLQE
jgi:hypothetical protein